MSISSEWRGSESIRVRPHSRRLVWSTISCQACDTPKVAIPKAYLLLNFPSFLPDTSTLLCEFVGRCPKAQLAQKPSPLWSPASSVRHRSWSGRRISARRRPRLPQCRERRNQATAQILRNSVRSEQRCWRTSAASAHSPPRPVEPCNNAQDWQKPAHRRYPSLWRKMSQCTRKKTV